MLKGIAQLLVGPATLLRSGPQPAGAQYVPLSGPDDERLPAALRKIFDAGERSLAERGFGPAVRAMKDPPGKLAMFVSLLEHPADAAAAYIMVSVSKAEVKVVVGFSTRFADGWRVLTSNPRMVLRTPRQPRVDGARFPDVKSAAELYAIHRGRVAERARTVPVAPRTPGTDLLAEQERESRETQAFWVERGTHRWVDGDRIELTPRGARHAVWRGLFPWKQFANWQADRKMRAILARLGRPAP